MERIPVFLPGFEGYFSPVSGAASPNTWHLMDNDHFYYGMLAVVQGQFVYHPNPAGSRLQLDQAAETMGQVIAAWYK